MFYTDDIKDKKILLHACCGPCSLGAIFSLADSFTDGAPFLPRDFKKRDGFLLSCRLARELGIYRQNFCGCEYSLASVQAQAAASGGAI